MSEEKSVGNAVEIVECESAEQLLGILNPLDERFGTGHVFRGHSRSEWRLVPSLHRRVLGDDAATREWSTHNDDWA